MTEKSSSIVTPEFRASYVNLFEPQENDEGKKVWGLTMVFEPDADLSGLKRLIMEAKIRKFGENYQGKLRNPLRKGTEDEFDLSKYPEYKGKIIATARAYKTPPGVVDRNKQPIVDPNQVYSGCYGLARISAGGYKNRTSGIGLYIMHFLKTRDGEPLVSRMSVDAAFEEVKLPDVDPSANSDFFGDDDDLGDI